MHSLLDCLHLVGVLAKSLTVIHGSSFVNQIQRSSRYPMPRLTLTGCGTKRSVSSVQHFVSWGGSMIWRVLFYVLLFQSLQVDILVHIYM